MAESGIIEIHGKEYHTVAKRVHDFRNSHTDYTIESEVLSAAELVMVRATIKEPSGRVLASGLAEENRNVGINKSSAVENAETSAVGRALAFLGYGGTEIASADEMSTALEAQKQIESIEYLMQHNAAVREHLTSLVVIKSSLAAAEYSTAKEAWNEIPEADQRALWVAPTKGGILTTEEREQMKSDDWRAANA